MSGLSIQAFYKKELLQSPRKASASSKHLQDDGFTKKEVEARNNPLDRPWTPLEEYREVCIAHIEPGPGLIRFNGRIVNYSAAFLDSKNIYSRPAHQLIVKDDTGAISVKLVPIGIPVSHLIIGQLVTVWASWTGAASNSQQGGIPFVSLYTPVNPIDVGTKQFIQFVPETPDAQSQCRVPLEYESNGPNPKPLPGLMTLGQYLKTGHDTRGSRILVCVKSIGSRKRIMVHDHTREAELVEVTVWDDTATCVLTLWEDKANSASLWRPNGTILLLTSPKFIAPRQPTPTSSPAGIGLSYNTLVDVDPDFTDADWLRNWVKDTAKKESIYIPFPKDVWNAQEAVHGPLRPLFTLAEVDDFARTDPATDFTGKLSLIILGMDLLGLHRRKMLCCIECCGVPLYANHPSATCKNCMKKKELVLNPRVMGVLADETGCIAQGKLVWSEQACSELFFPSTAADSASSATNPSYPSSSASWTELVGMETVGLRMIEEQMMYARFTLIFG
ncbi:nucleic acid-binding protein [Colletotrichum plurivorum]|uniref:Nucleic acid-binding protein n=1 Tax=Colletotrichum plurivorum TaxID=2175906 RepID=A0A8H6K815_9PEZI|nr:nucleic acid-binding protein [Colletotrichum plurivorum]